MITATITLSEYQWDDVIGLVAEAAERTRTQTIARGLAGEARLQAEELVASRREIVSAIDDAVVDAEREGQDEARMAAY